MWLTWTACAGTSPFPSRPLWKEVAGRSPRGSSREWCLLPLGREWVSASAFWVPGWFVCLPHVLICSIICQCGLTDFHFILWVIIQYYFILFSKLLRFGPRGAFSLDPLVPLIHLHPCGFVFLFLSISLLLGATRYSRLVVYISCPSPGIRHFSKEKWFLFLFLVPFIAESRNQDGDIRCAWCYWVSVL